MYVQAHSFFKWPFLLLAIGIALTSTNPFAGENISPKVMGLWVVQDSACNGCDPAKGAETGAMLRINEQGVQDPFSSDCHKAVQSKEVSTEPYASLQERLGVPARWLVAQSKPELNVVSHFDILCGDKTVLKIIALPNGELLRPSEASTVLHFRRP